MTMLAGVVDAVIGIDTHRDSHEAEIADAAGRPIATMQISNDSAGYGQLLAAITKTAPGPRVAVCVEGSRSYGIGLVPRSDAITLGSAALRERPRARQTQPPRHPHRRPRLNPRHLGLLAHRHPYDPATHPAARQALTS
jgi:hypothetical protein